jgi:hypothetical protein
MKEEAAALTFANDGCGKATEMVRDENPTTILSSTVRERTGW